MNGGRRKRRKPSGMRRDERCADCQSLLHRDEDRDVKGRKLVFSENPIPFKRSEYRCRECTEKLYAAYEGCAAALA